MVTKKNKLIIGIIILMLVMPLVIAPGCTGGQVLSIDDVNIRYSTELQKEVIRVLFSTIPTAECLDISLSESQIEEELAKNGIEFDARHRILGDIKLTEKTKIFNIRERPTEIFRKVGITQIGDQVVCTDNDCRDAGISNPISSIGFGISLDCFCVFIKDEGIEGEFISTTGISWETEIKIGNNPILTLSNEELSGRIGNIAFVKWAGNLNSNVDLDNPNRDTYKPFSDNQFRMTDDGTYQILRDNFLQVTGPSSRVVECNEPSIGPLCDNALVDVNGYNAQFDTLTTDGTFAWASQEPLVNYAEILNNNQMIADLTTPIVYPQFTLDIDAEEVGIFISVGKPEVICPANFNIISGQTESAFFKLKNIGENNGAFSFSLDCDKGGYFLSPQPPQVISSQGTLDITGTMSLTVPSGSESASCTFTGKELNSLEEDSCGFSFTSTHQSQCITGTKNCELGNTELWTCLSNGEYSKVKCKYGCIYVDGEAECSSQPIHPVYKTCIDCDAWALSRIFNLFGETDSEFIQERQCTAKKPSIIPLSAGQSSVVCIFSIIKLALVPVVLIFASLFSFNLFQNTKQLKIKDRTLATLLSLSLGLIAAVLAYVLWWVGLLALGVVILVRVVIK